MTDLHKAAQQALAFTMRDFASLRDFEAAKAVLHDNLRAALAQQDEPVAVAWALSHSRGIEFSSRYPMQESRDAAEQLARQHMGAVTVTPLYTAPPPPQRKPLTSDKDRPDQGTTYVGGYGYVDTRAVRAIERAHGIGEQP